MGPPCLLALAPDATSTMWGSPRTTGRGTTPRPPKDRPFSGNSSYCLVGAAAAELWHCARRPHGPRCVGTDVRFLVFHARGLSVVPVSYQWSQHPDTLTSHEEPHLGLRRRHSERKESFGRTRTASREVTPNAESFCSRRWCLQLLAEKSSLPGGQPVWRDAPERADILRPRSLTGKCHRYWWRRDSGR